MPVSRDELDKMEQDPILAALARRGITADVLAQKLDEELNAMQVEVYFDKRFGEVAYSEPLIDWQTRQKARVDAHKLRGDYPAEKKEIGVGLSGVGALLDEIAQNPEPLPFEPDAGGKQGRKKAKK